jgi:hypothetical protein
MKTYLTLVCLFLSLASFSQKRDTGLIEFWVTCGAGAQTSEEIQLFQKLNKLNNYSTIRQKLFNGNEVETVLSAIILKHYLINNLIELTQAELDKIDQIAKSKKKYSLCFTCTFHEAGTLKQLFTKKGHSYDLLTHSLLDAM